MSDIEYCNCYLHFEEHDQAKPLHLNTVRRSVSKITRFYIIQLSANAQGQSFSHKQYLKRKSTNAEKQYIVIFDKSSKDRKDFVRNHIEWSNIMAVGKVIDSIVKALQLLVEPL